MSEELDGEGFEFNEWEKEEINRRKDFKPGNPAYDLALKEGRIVWGGLGAFEIPANNPLLKRNNVE